MKTLRIALFALACALCGVVAQAQTNFGQIQLVPGSTAGASMNTAQMPATPALTTPKNSSGNFFGFLCINIGALPVYIHAFDQISSSITLGTTSANYNVPCPSNAASTGAGFSFVPSAPILFTTGMSYIVSSAAGATDHTAIASGSIVWIIWTYL